MEFFLLLLLLAFLPLMTGIVSYRGALWCLKQRNRAWRLVLGLVLAAAAAGTSYGLLRLSGLLRLPGDNTISWNFFDASWRDDGAGVLQIFTGPLCGGIAALLYCRRHKGDSGGN